MALRSNQIFNEEFNHDQRSTTTEYVVPEGIKVLGYSVFCSFEKLKNVTLPSSLVEIRDSAFLGCFSLEGVNIPKGVTSIGRYAFSDCEAIKEITLPETLEEIGTEAFIGCLSLKKIRIPSNVKKLEYAVFRTCKNLEEVELPKNLTFIDSNVFTDCSKLKSIEFPKKIKELSYGLFASCKSLKDVVLPSGLKKINVAAFEGCSSLEGISLPNGLKEIESSAFQGCTNLDNVVLPKKITYIADRAFSDCSSLKNIQIPNKVKSIGPSAFSNCVSLENFVVPEGVISIGDYAFSNCTSLKTIKLSKKLTELERGTFKYCTELESIDLSNIKVLDEEVFHGCYRLKEIVLPEKLEKLGAGCFAGCNFNYIYKLKGKKNLVFSQTLPENAEFDRVVNVGMFKKAVMDIDITVLANEEKTRELLPLIESLNSAKTTIPNSFFQQFLNNETYREQIKDMNFKFFGAEVKEIRARLVTLPSADARLAMMKFASVLGCFSNEKMLDKEGKETPTIMAQKASTFFASIINNNRIPTNKYVRLFNSISLDIKPNQEFLKFLSAKGENKSFPNLELLLELSEEYRGDLFAKVASRFDEVKALRVGLDENGKPYNLSWQDAIIKFKEANNFNNVTEDTRDIAKLFTEKRLSQEAFDKAANLRKESISEGVKQHILSTPLREETIMEKIERIRKQTDYSMVNAQQLIDELYEQKFTYEMLDKHDPKNAIIGLYCSCCATITSAHYGKEIAAATMVAHDVQNLVVRDLKGDIVAKGTLYVNSAKGYAVVNDFEVNEKYRQHEYGSGMYDVADDHADEQERELIFQTFKRGLLAFVKQYDAEHTDKPIQVVTVGMGYNRLKRQCERYKEQTNYLQIPEKYNFYDAKEEQRTLYVRGKSEQSLLVNVQEEGREQ